MPTNKKQNKGFAALVPVIIIGGLIIAIASGVAVRARTQVLASIYNAYGAQALAMAHACGDIAIGKLQTVFGYAGNETISTNGITCTILPITGTGNYDRVITAHATIHEQSKKIRITITKISSPTEISSWEIIPF
jgi:hypothetical protein